MSAVKPAQLGNAPNRNSQAARRGHAPGRFNRSVCRRGHSRAYPEPHRLGAYRGENGRGRELLAIAGRDGSVLVIDCDRATSRDRRLLAHLGADEPAVNAELVCRDYLSHPRRPRPRRLRPGDLLACPGHEACESSALADDACAIDVHGQIHRLCRLCDAGGRSELRWGCSLDSRTSVMEPVSLRELVGRLERYEPVRTITAAAIRSHRHRRGVSIRCLREEYRRLCTSPVVLNRALREAVLRVTASGELTMSEIALRCGIVKRDRRGGHGGETSWLARRVGLMPEGGATRITPWIHSDVLALIAREGLRMSPFEVEVS